jgi:mycothiol synthase
MQFTTRMYSGAGDFLQMCDVVVTARAAGSRQWHLGDLIWGMYQNTVFDPHTQVRLWEDEQSQLAGFAWYDLHGFINWAIHPRTDDRDLLAEQMLAWGEAQCREQPGKPEHVLRASALENDVADTAFLLQHGFRRDESHLLHMVQELDRSLPEPSLPVGWTVRHVDGEGEWAERVETHREVWHPSRVTLEAYRRLRAAPGYIPELDLVAVAPDGSFGAYCICWLDPVNQSGEFEPVGTRPAFRGKGIGKAVMLEGLRRLKAHGAQTALVLSTGTNEPARRLYESSGFRTIDRHWDFSKTC